MKDPKGWDWVSISISFEMNGMVCLYPLSSECRGTFFFLFPEWDVDTFAFTLSVKVEADIIYVEMCVPLSWVISLTGMSLL